MKFVVKNADDFAQKIFKLISDNSKDKLKIGLKGDLGAGKTTLVKMLAKSFGVEEVTSPTFNIRKVYPIEFQNFKKLQHIDLYRLEDISKADMSEVLEWLNEDNTLTFIEWPERIENYQKYLDILISIRDLGEGKREVTVEFIKE